jgi:ATP-dependent Lon protease
VLPVGGIKEKILAANRSGIKQIIIPLGNKNDLDEIPEKIKKQLTFHQVNKMDEVLKLALDQPRKTSRHKG